MQRLRVAFVLTVTVLVLSAGYWLFRSSESALGARASGHEGLPGSAQRWVTFEGACDASGAVPIDERHFAVADDEDNVIRVYDALLGGKPVRRTNLSKQIGLERKSES